MERITGQIRKYDGERLVIVAPYSGDHFLLTRQVKECEVCLRDNREITARQRRYIYAMLRDIAAYTGHSPEELKDYFKAQWVAQTGGEWFSLSDTDMTTANELIEIIIGFCVEWCIPTKDNLAEFAPDIGRYIYLCLTHKVCCITRQKAELHHVDAVGAGRNRKEIVHQGMKVLPLSRKLHIEIHSIGKERFCEKYHVYGVALDAELCRIWKVRS